MTIDDDSKPGQKEARETGTSAGTVGAAVPTAHGSYRALLGDPDVDVIYVATPHPHHRALALAALAAGKAVLVEKSFTVTPAATREIVAAAGAVGRFAMEAMWTRFCPAMVPLSNSSVRPACFCPAILGVLLCGRVDVMLMRR